MTVTVGYFLSGPSIADQFRERGAAVLVGATVADLKLRRYQICPTIRLDAVLAADPESPTGYTWKSPDEWPVHVCSPWPRSDYPDYYAAVARETAARPSPPPA